MISETKPKKLLYILSPSFSGSTLLTLLLAQHPKIATIGELKATSMGPLEDYVCSCGEPILKCSFWSSMQSVAASANMDFNVSSFGTHFSSQNALWNKIFGAQVRGRPFESVRFGMLHHMPGLKNEYQKVLQQNKAFIDLTLELQKATIFLDGSKDPHRLLYLLDSGDYDISVIKMTRDGRAQSHSQRSKSAYTLGYEAAVHEWRYTIEQMERAVEWFPEELVVSVKYEDLCAAPTGFMNRLWQFLDLEPTDHDWNNVDLKASEHHILGNNMRTKSHIKLSLDERWQSEVSESELEIFNSIAGEMNRKLGY